MEQIIKHWIVLLQLLMEHGIIVRVGGMEQTYFLLLMEQLMGQ